MMDTFAKDIDQIIDQLEFNDKKPIKVSIKSYEKIYFPTGKYPLCVKPQKNQDSRWNIYECKENGKFYKKKYTYNPHTYTMAGRYCTIDDKYFYCFSNASNVLSYMRHDKENPTIDIVCEKKIFRLSKLNKTMYHDTKCNVSYKLKGGKIVIDKYRTKFDDITSFHVSDNYLFAFHKDGVLVKLSTDGLNSKYNYDDENDFLKYDTVDYSVHYEPENHNNHIDQNNQHNSYENEQYGYEQDNYNQTSFQISGYPCDPYYLFYPMGYYICYPYYYPYYYSYCPVNYNQKQMEYYYHDNQNNQHEQLREQTEKKTEDEYKDCEFFRLKWQDKYCSNPIVIGYENNTIFFKSDIGVFKYNTEKNEIAKIKIQCDIKLIEYMDFDKAILINNKTMTIMKQK